MGKKAIYVLVGAWFFLIVVALIVSQFFNKGEQVPAFPSEDTQSLEREGKLNTDSGPISGDILDHVESAQQTVARFLQYVNLGNYDDAAGFIEPNVLVQYTSEERKELSVRDAVVEFVKLFDPETADGFKVSNPEYEGYYTRVEAKVQYAEKNSEDFIFDLKQLDDHDHEHQPAVWYIYKIQKK